MDRPLTELIDATVKLLKLPANPQMSELFQQIIVQMLDQEVDDPNKFLIDLLEKSRPDVDRQTVGQAIRLLTAQNAPSAPKTVNLTNNVPEMVMIGGMRSNVVFIICAIVILVFYAFIGYKINTILPFSALTKGIFTVVIDFLLAMTTGKMQILKALVKPFHTIDNFLQPKKYLYIVELPSGTYVSLVYFDKINNTLYYEYPADSNSATIKIEPIQKYSKWIGHNERAEASLKNRYAGLGYNVDNLLVIPLDFIISLNGHPDRMDALTKESFDFRLQSRYIEHQARPVEQAELASINETMESLTYATDDLQPFIAKVPNCLAKLAEIKARLLHLRRIRPILESEITQYQYDATYVESMADMAADVSLIDDTIIKATELNDARLNPFIAKLTRLRNLMLSTSNTLSSAYVVFTVEDLGDIVLTSEDNSVFEILISGFDYARQIGPAANLALEQLIDIVNRPAPRPFFYPSGSEILKPALTSLGTPFTAYIRIDLNEQEEGIIANAVASMQQMLAAAAPIGRKNATDAGRAAFTALHNSAVGEEPEVFANSAVITDPITLENIQAGEKYAYWIGGGGLPIVACTWTYFQEPSDTTAMFHIADGTIVDLPYQPITADGRIKVIVTNTHHAADQFRWTTHAGLANIAQIIKKEKKKRRTQAEITAANAAAFLGSAPLNKRRTKKGGRRNKRKTRQRR